MGSTLHTEINVKAGTEYCHNNLRIDDHVDAILIPINPTEINVPVQISLSPA